ncbi:hypothetical protein WJX73_004725 [Symbiochloris irregularis]|uniref:KOW domain-containing protein n=1 Tax=Symbiochloris irregularis TaxID=706552 RepID=A0AAW1NXQ5_9CHLO
MTVVRRAIKSMFARDKWKILRGDTVFIAAGKDKGQIGTVTKVYRDSKIPKVLVQGRNLNKRFVKRAKDNPGGVVSVESPIHYSNVSLLDPVTSSPVRTSFRFLEDGTKVRVTRGRKATQSFVPRPDALKQRRKPIPLPGAKDTDASVAAMETYSPQQYPQQWLQQLQSFPAPKGMPPQAYVRKFSTCNCNSGDSAATPLLHQLEFTAHGRARGVSSLKRSAGLSTFASRPFVL